MFSKINQIFRSLIGSENPDNRRRHPRQERRTRITLQPFDQDLSPMGRPIEGMTIDFSQSGIGFTCMCQEKLDCPYVQVTVVEDEYSAIGRIRHVRETDQPDSFLYGVEFLDDQE